MFFLRGQLCYNATDLAGLDLDLVDKRGRTVLHICAAKNDTVGLKRLISYGAKKDVKDINGNLPYQLASDRSVVVELGGNPEEVLPKVPPKKLPFQHAAPPLSNTKILSNKVIRINPKKIVLPALQKTTPDVPVATRKNNISSVKPPIVPSTSLATPTERKESSIALALPQDRKSYQVSDSRSDDDSGSDCER